MAADESDKRKGYVSSGGIIKPHKSPLSASESTGDPLRDAIIAQGREEAFEQQVFDAALAQERELLAQGRRHALWEPPTEQEFNEEWFTPLDALEVSDIRMADDADKWEIVEKLRAGQIIAVARTGQLRGDIEGVQPFVHVHSGAWSRMDQAAEHFFWQKASLVVRHRDYGNQRFFDIRFDPETFSGKPPPRMPSEAETQQSKARPANLPGARRKDWWDLVWIEMFRRIQAGTLNPKDQTELQHTLEDYVDEIGGKYGDSTMKPMASNLFKYLQELRGK